MHIGMGQSRAEISLAGLLPEQLEISWYSSLGGCCQDWFELVPYRIHIDAQPYDKCYLHRLD